MFPGRPLTVLAARKAALRREIAADRAHCVAAVTRWSRLVEGWGAAWRLARRWSDYLRPPVAPAPKRGAGNTGSLIAELLRWSPVLFACLVPGRPRRKTPRARRDPA